MELPEKATRLTTVKVENDHLKSIAGPSRNLMGGAEMIWNALDAEADHVQVRLEVNAIDGGNVVEVVDGGHGMSLKDKLEIQSTTDAGLDYLRRTLAQRLPVSVAARAPRAE